MCEMTRRWFLGCVAAFGLGVSCVSPSEAEDFTTLYGTARKQARQISSNSLAVPMPPEQWQATLAEDNP